MNIEDQVCSLELAKRLKELGVKQESLFTYFNIDGEGKYHIYFCECLPEEGEYAGKPIAAFTVAELGEMLPNAIAIDDKEDEFNHYRINIKKFNYVESPATPLEVKPSWIINYYDNTIKEGGTGLIEVTKSLLRKSVWDKSEANARAKCVIKLIEEGFVESGNCGNDVS